MESIVSQIKPIPLLNFFLTFGNQLPCTVFQRYNYLEWLNTIIQACASFAFTAIPVNSINSQLDSPWETTCSLIRVSSSIGNVSRKISGIKSPKTILKRILSALIMTARSKIGLSSFYLQNIQIKANIFHPLRDLTKITKSMPTWQYTSWVVTSRKSF